MQQIKVISNEAKYAYPFPERTERYIKRTLRQRFQSGAVFEHAWSHRIIKSTFDAKTKLYTDIVTVYGSDYLVLAKQ